MMVRNFAVLRTFTRNNKLINFAPIIIRGNHYERSNSGRNNFNKYGKVTAVAIFSSVFIGSGITDTLNTKEKVKNKEKAPKTEENVPFEAGLPRPDLPTYSADEVSKHDNKDSFWVTYKHGVYDVTAFLPVHPGAEQILNAGGLSIEPFWNVYGMHKTPEVFRLLESYRIGNLNDQDVVEHSDEELWVHEPVRDARLVIKTKRPFNAEIPPQHQIQHFDTPNELFYVRQHMPVPELDASAHTLYVELHAAGGAPSARSPAPPARAQFSLQQLSAFPRVSVRAALMCAGNRRSEMDKVKPVKGISWQGGAISNAVWSGVLLRDVLLHMGCDENHTEGRHVIFQGADIDATGVNFSTSIPLHQAMSVGARVLLATHMNGAPLPADHGRPLRALVPGAPAVRSVKWLEKIIISDEESPSHWHQKDYRSFNPSTTWETADFPSAPPVYSLPVTSAICAPADGQAVRVRDGCISVRGYAYSGGGAKIVRVDVSADRGRSWAQAAPVQQDGAPPAQHYAWTLWEASIPVRADQHEVELWAKATDSNFNTQPENFDHIWNIRGILSNAYHKISVPLIHETNERDQK